MKKWGLFGSASYFFYRWARHYIRRLRTSESLLNIGPGTNLVKCPRCYTYVPEDTAMRVMANGYLLHFCSPECLESYRRDHQEVDARAIDDETGK